jgi:hypothetical protein
VLPFAVGIGAIPPAGGNSASTRSTLPNQIACRFVLGGD